MSTAGAFHLPHFIPFLLNQAAEAASRDFQSIYRRRYGMLRTEWRVLFHLGVYGTLTAKRICDQASLHKTKVSRAVRALEKKRFLKRQPDANDRRVEKLMLTARGRAVFRDLNAAAEDYERRLASAFSDDEFQRLRESLLKLAGSHR